MPRVIRNKPNGSGLINGIKFHPLEDGRLISDEIDQETADHFCLVPGYELDLEDDDSTKIPESPKAPVLTKKQQREMEKAQKAAAAQAGADDTNPAAAGTGEDGGDTGAATAGAKNNANPVF